MTGGFPERQARCGPFASRKPATYQKIPLHTAAVRQLEWLSHLQLLGGQALRFSGMTAGEVFGNADELTDGTVRSTEAATVADLVHIGTPGFGGRMP